MTKICCIPNCRLQSDLCLNMSFFQIPRNENTRHEWANSINKYFNQEIVFKKFSVVCALHFEPSCFTYGYGLCKILRLKKGSCPSIFEDYSSTEDQIQNVEVLDQDNSEDVPLNICNNDHCNESQKQRICNHSISNDHEINANARPQDIRIKDESHSVSSDDCENTMEMSEINNMDQSSKKFSETPLPNNLIYKSLANINLDLINFDDKTMTRRILEKAQNEIRLLRRSRKVQAMRLYRARKKVKNSESLIGHVKKHKLISDKVAEILQESVSAQASDLFKRILQGPEQRREFPPSLRSFATTLHFYSPKAYNYVRNTFVKCLPHPFTVSKWHRNTEFMSDSSQESKGTTDHS